VPAVSYRLDGNVAVLEIDNPPVNATSINVRTGLAEALQAAAVDPQVEAIVLAGRNGMFLAGADINEISSGLANQFPTLRDLQSQMESIAKPIVAAIEGVALGGGFEIALACHWRVMSKNAKVGLPEVKLGLLPGAGGTQRFTRLAGPEAALEAITSGSQIPAERALALGLVDEISSGATLDDDAPVGAMEARGAVAHDSLAHSVLSDAIKFARRAARDRTPLRLASDLTERVTNIPPEIFAAFRKKIGGKTRGQLAPGKIIDCIEAACALPKQEAFQLERDLFEECRASPQRKALVHVFFAEREARRIPDVPAGVKPLPIRNAAIIGAGTMGGGIAMNFANAGIPVQLLELTREALDRGLGLIRKNYSASVTRGSLTQEGMDRAMSLITGVTQYEALAQADIVIEAVFEDMKVKTDVFTRLDSICAPHAILATNTSSLDIDAIAAVTARPQNVIGTHFFSPANVMKLLENVRGKHSSPQTIATVMSLGRTLNKVVVLAGNCDGFIGNRMLQFYSGEAEFLLEEGATPEQIDRVMECFGFAMGPLAVRDLAGNDVGYLIRKGRRIPSDERFSPILQRVYEAGRLGQKSGKGFYRYEGRTRIPDPEIMTLIEGVSRELGITRRAIPDEEILSRLLHPLVNEGARIVEEGIAIRSSDVDVVYVNGYGFPAYKGGPMFWAQETGFDRVVATMRKLAPSHGQRWRPAALLERLAATGRGWSDLPTQPAAGS
jgi:3-hydroxyacyl-CoA dehydrogenase